MDGIAQTVKMAAVYPEALSRHNRCLTQLSNNVIECSPHMYKRSVKKKTDRKGRFRTQPVTFMEIKEVDEERSEEGLASSCQDFSDGERSRSEVDLKAKFEDIFSRNLSNRRHNSRKRLEIPEAAGESQPSPGEEEESRDRVEEDFSLRIQVNYPKGFNFRSRPSF